MSFVFGIILGEVSMQRLNLSALRPLRSLMVAFACALILFSSAVPAFALGTSKSKPSDGVANLDNIEKRAEQVAKSDPSYLDMEKTQQRTQAGFNEVQGGADLDKMNNPSNSQDATTVVDQIEGALEKASGKK
jgi:hypothetical protein